MCRRRDRSRAGQSNAGATWTDGVLQSLSLSKAFANSAGLKMSYTAYETAGPNVTGWMSFNPGTVTFSGTPPSTLTGVATIEVIATDSSGHSATDLFAISFANGAAHSVNLVGAVPMTTALTPFGG